MAGIIAIYGVVVAVLIAGQLAPAGVGSDYTLYKWVVIWCWTAIYVGPLYLSGCVESSSCLVFQGLRALGSRAFSWSLWSSGRLRHRHRWWCWCPWHRTATQALRRHDPHPYLRRGAGSLRAHRRHLSVRQEIEREVIYKPFFRRGINIYNNQQSIGLCWSAVTITSIKADIQNFGKYQ